MVYLVIQRYRDTAILPHLRTHLEHVILQLLLMFQLRKKTAFLQRRGIGTVSWLSCLVLFTAYHSRVERRLHLRAGDKSSPTRYHYFNILDVFCQGKNTGAGFPPRPKGRGFHPEDFDETLDTY